MAYNLVNGLASGFDLVNVGSNPNGITDAPDLDLNADFTPNMNSPVINSGDTTGILAGEKDFAGNDRISDTAVDIGAQEFQIPLGIHEYQDSISATKMRIHPNPANEILYFQNAVGVAEAQVSIYDIIGKLQLNTSLNPEKQVNIQKLKKRVYIAMVVAQNSRQYFKFVKM